MGRRGGKLVAARRDGRGARGKSRPLGEMPLDDLAAAMYALSGLIDTESLADWNDDPRQTQETVLEMLDRAAAAYVEPELLVGLSSN
jgi:hypothetical protein